MTTLIIGCGYLGERLGARLVRDGGRVFGTVRSPGRAAEIARSGIEPVIADVLRPDSLRSAARGRTGLLRVGFDRSAGAAMRDVYVDGLQNVLDRLPTSVRRFVYASSTGVYGQTGGEWVDEESPTDPEHESGRVVLEAEGRVRAWADSRGASAVILRFAGLYGPGRIVRRAMLERGEPIPGDPEKFLNLVHIDDAAAAAAAALDADATAPIYLVADDRPVTRREYYSVAARLIGAARAPVRAAPARQPRGGTRRDQQAHRQPSDEGGPGRRPALSRHHDRPAPLGVDPARPQPRRRLDVAAERALGDLHPRVRPVGDDLVALQLGQLLVGRVDDGAPGRVDPQGQLFGLRERVAEELDEQLDDVRERVLLVVEDHDVVRGHAPRLLARW